MAIDINKLTIGEAKQLIKDLAGFQSKKIESEFEPVPSKSFKNPSIGKYCIVRCRNAGVHAGIVKQANAEFVELKDSRRLWFWKSAFTLSEAANEGVTSESKIAAPLAVLVIPTNDVCELIPTSDKARKSIEGAKEYHA